MKSKNNYGDQLINLYQGLGLKSYFAKIRLWDAPYSEVEKLISKKGTIVDIGCGEGLFANYLALTSPQRSLLGIELDHKRIKDANRGLPNVKFRHADATKISLPQSDAFIMFHLLHHLLSYKDQELVIKNCIKNLKKNGKLIIVEIDVKPSLKYLTTWFTDHFLVPWLFEKRFYSPIYFRNTNQWKTFLTSQGLTCSFLNAEKGKPFSHVIFVCSKK